MYEVHLHPCPWKWCGSPDPHQVPWEVETDRECHGRLDLHSAFSPTPQVHPEMFDQNGNLVPDEIVAFRFENNYDNDEEDDEN